MENRKIKTKIVLTNWVSIVGILLAVYLFGIISELIMADTTGDISSSIWTGFIGGLIGLILYGTIFFVGFIICMLILDLLLIGEEGKHLRTKLLIEWVLISAPFVYWVFKYTEWVFLVAIITFLVTQAIRERLILKLLSGTASTT